MYLIHIPVTQRVFVPVKKGTKSRSKFLFKMYMKESKQIFENELIQVESEQKMKDH